MKTKVQIVKNKQHDGVTLEDSTLSNFKLLNCQIDDITIDTVNIEHCTLQQTNLSMIHAINLNMKHTQLDRKFGIECANIDSMQLTSSKIRNGFISSSFIQGILEDVQFSNVGFEKCVFIGCYFSDVTFKNCVFKEVSFTGCTFYDSVIKPLFEHAVKCPSLVNFFPKHTLGCFHDFKDDYPEITVDKVTSNNFIECDVTVEQILGNTSRKSSNCKNNNLIKETSKVCHVFMSQGFV